MDPVKLGVEVLCRRDTTLITAETTLKLILTKLLAEETNFSKELVNSFCKRIKERMTIQSVLLLYLHDPIVYLKELRKSDLNQTQETFKLEKKSNLREQMKIILEKFLPEEEQPGLAVSLVSGTSGNDSSSDRPYVSDSIREELYEKLATSFPPIMKKKENFSKKNLEQELKKEMIALKQNGTRGKLLNLLYKYLLTIPPTSVEAERAFSAVGLICSHLRTRLADDSLSSICFLRSYFQAQKDT